MMKLEKPTRFVIYGAMRTGSNYLVSLLNQFPDVVCHGEAFNPGFVGLREDYHEKLGIGRDEPQKRDANEQAFYDKLMKQEDSSQVIGFKLFPGHSEYAISTTLADSGMAKIILRRDVLTSFISLCQAELSGVWMIRDTNESNLAKSREKSDIKIVFDGPRFLRYRKLVSDFYSGVERSLQNNGQEYLTFWYKDLNSADILSRLSGLLKIDFNQALDTSKILAKQNTSPPHLRVDNLAEMVDFLDAHGYATGVVEAARNSLSGFEKQSLHVLNGVNLDLNNPALSPQMRTRIRSGKYERQESRAVVELVRPNDVVLELGGGVGYISSLAWKTCQPAKIIVVEANPDTIPVIQTTHKLNSVDAELINGVASIQHGQSSKVPFYIRNDFWASSLSTEPWGWCKQVEVPLVDVQHLIDFHACTFLICDIEGGEADLIPSLELTSIEKIILELHPAVTGVQPVRRIFRHFSNQGFKRNRNLSSGAVVVFQK